MQLRRVIDNNAHYDGPSKAWSICNWFSRRKTGNSTNVRGLGLTLLLREGLRLRPATDKPAPATQSMRAVSDLNMHPTCVVCMHKYTGRFRTYEYLHHFRCPANRHRALCNAFVRTSLRPKSRASPYVSSRGASGQLLIKSACLGFEFKNQCLAAHPLGPRTLTPFRR